MDSIGQACNELKKQYDACFNTWFAEHFLKGNTNDAMCSQIFQVYQQCVKDAMKQHNIEIKDAEVDLLGTDKEKEVPPGKS